MFILKYNLLLKNYLIILTVILFTFVFWPCRILVCKPGLNWSPLHQQGRVVATRPPGKSCSCMLYLLFCFIFWHYWRDRHKFEQVPGVGNGQGGLACCSPWDQEESDTTERLNWTNFLGLCCYAGAFSSYVKWGLLFCCEASHCSCFSCCRAQAPGLRA